VTSDVSFGDFELAGWEDADPRHFTRLSFRLFEEIAELRGR
jgi:hypothetical protein